MRILSRTLAVVIAIALSITIARAASDNSYLVTVLASNLSGVAPVTDMKLVNGWGIAASATSPWWVSDNGSGWATVYSGAGVKAGVEVTVPGAPTGMVSYSGTAFLLAVSRPARFMFASEDGTISAWNPQFDASHAHVVIGAPGSESNYKGLAISGDTLYTTDFGECAVEAFDNTFHEFDTVGGFRDPSIKRGYCPFGIQAIGTSIFVTYALKDGDDDVPGISHGFVREFDTAGHLIAQVATHGTLSSPWGLALAPANFGRFSNCMLVGNFGNGEIHAYCKGADGVYEHEGTLREGNRRIAIDGLWGIGFGNGAGSGPRSVLYFAAGPDDEVNGAFGKIDFVP